MCTQHARLSVHVLVLRVYFLMFTSSMLCLLFCFLVFFLILILSGSLPLVALFLWANVLWVAGNTFRQSLQRCMHRKVAIKGWRDLSRLTICHLDSPKPSWTYQEQAEKVFGSERAESGIGPWLFSLHCCSFTQHVTFFVMVDLPLEFKYNDMKSIYI